MVDNFDGLYRDGAKSGRLMVVNVHPWVMGWPWRSVPRSRPRPYQQPSECVEGERI